jgi:DNA-binding response OmpR family regulator
VADYILIVEDDAGIRQFIDVLLSKEGYETAGAPNEEVAQQMIARRQPELILLDMQMPMMNGSEFLERLSLTTDRHIPVIIVTVDHLVLTSEDAQKADDILIKPFRVDELLTLMAKHLPRSEG